MPDIRINVSIKAAPQTIYDAITTQEGLSSWWAKQTIAKPEVGFLNVFTFGTFRNAMKIIELTPKKRVEWECTESMEEWVGTHVIFNLEEKGERTVLRFSHSGWRAATDMMAGCTYDWSLFMKSLKMYCETGVGSPS